jgi:hypothetical protein
MQAITSSAPQASPNPRAEPFVGRFSGNVVCQECSPPSYPVTLTLWEAAVTEKVGETQYSLQHCRGRLVLLEKTSGELRVQENIVQYGQVTDADLVCAKAPLYFTVRPAAGGKVELHYFRDQTFSGSSYAVAVLQRVER